jgi:hypothetical protein
MYECLPTTPHADHPCPWKVNGESSRTPTRGIVSLSLEIQTGSFEFTAETSTGGSSLGPDICSRTSAAPETRQLCLGGCKAVPPGLTAGRPRARKYAPFPTPPRTPPARTADYPVVFLLGRLGAAPRPVQRLFPRLGTQTGQRGSLARFPFHQKFISYSCQGGYTTLARVWASMICFAGPPVIYALLRMDV